MTDIYDRTRKLIGQKALDKLIAAKVVVFGLGGVGSYAVEALARSGVGHIAIVDKDKVDLTNINRQIVALNSTVGQYKSDVMEKRINDINPKIKVEKYTIFYNINTSNIIDLSCFDYVVDAIDTVSSKLQLIEKCNELSVPIISSMGFANKLNPTMIEVGDIYCTCQCPLARVMRYELKKRKIPSLKVVYSKEQTIIKQRQPASISFMPSSAGLILAYEVIKDIMGEI